MNALARGVLAIATLAVLSTCAARAWGEESEPEPALPAEALPTGTAEELVAGFLAATERKERARFESAVLALEKSGALDAGRLADVLADGAIETYDRTPFTDRGKQGVPKHAWSDDRVEIVELGSAAPDTYTMVLPPDYEPDGERRHAVVLDLGDGAGSLLAGRIRAVVAFVHPDAIPAAGLAGSRQGQSLVLSILADLARRVRVDPDGIFITGGGRNGNAVYYLAAHHAHLFAGAMPYAGRLEELKIFERNVRRLVWVILSRQAGPQTLGNYEYSFEVFERLKALGSDARFRLLDAATANDTLARELGEVVAATVRDPWPAALDYRMDDDDHPEHYWVRIDKVARPGRAKVVKIMGALGEVAATRTVNSNLAEVKARRSDDRRRLEIETTNVSHLTVYLSPRLVDFDAEVEIVVNGKVRYHEKPRASLRFMLSRYRTTRDPSALPWLRVPLLDV